MSEEIKRQNPELNDAALSGVSGGARESVKLIASITCQRCLTRSQSYGYSCTGGEAALAEYLSQSLPLRPFYDCLNCPFLKKK